MSAIPTDAGRPSRRTKEGNGSHAIKKRSGRAAATAPPTRCGDIAPRPKPRSKLVHERERATASGPTL